jgi:5-formyltetrahydrofolate cyclo-ligase
LDVLIVPGRAYTTTGYRLGRGKGYYDRYLARYKDKNNGKLPYLIGLAFSEQICDSIPVNDTDWKLDEVIYDERRNICVN